MPSSKKILSFHQLLFLLLRLTSQYLHSTFACGTILSHKCILNSKKKVLIWFLEQKSLMFHVCTLYICTFIPETIFIFSLHDGRRSLFDDPILYHVSFWDLIQSSEKTHCPQCLWMGKQFNIQSHPFRIFEHCCIWHFCIHIIHDSFRRINFLSKSHKFIFHLGIISMASSALIKRIFL